MSRRELFGQAMIAVACSVVRALDDHDDGPEVLRLTNFTARKCTVGYTCVGVYVRPQKAHSFS